MSKKKQKKADYTKDFYFDNPLGKWFAPGEQGEMRYLQEQNKYCKEAVSKKEDEFATAVRDVERAKYFEELFTKQEMEKENNV